MLFRVLSNRNEISISAYVEAKATHITMFLIKATEVSHCGAVSGFVCEKLNIFYKKKTYPYKLRHYSL
jgi:cell division protein FtsX